MCPMPAVTGRTLLAVSLLLALPTGAAGPSLVGRWACEGSGETLDYRSDRTVEVSGRFSTWAASRIPMDPNADGATEMLELATRDTGKLVDR